MFDIRIFGISFDLYPYTNPAEDGGRCHYMCPYTNPAEQRR